jgi:hypothetical protein
MVQRGYNDLWVPCSYAVSGGAPIVTGGGIFLGYIVQANANGVLGRIRVFDNTSVAGVPIADVKVLAAEETQFLWMGPNGVRFNTGLTAAVASGGANIARWCIFYLADP